MNKKIVALTIACVVWSGCLENATEKDTIETENDQEQLTTLEETVLGKWHQFEGSSELTTIIFEKDGNATVYFGCDCPESKEQAQWSIIDNYLDVAAESRTQRYVYKLENGTLYLRTLTEKDFSTFEEIG